MTAGERDLVDRARDELARQINARYPGWSASHDMYGWQAERLADAHQVRAAGPDGLQALMAAAPPVSTTPGLGELRRDYPDWQIWRDGRGGWHAKRRGNFKQEQQPGAPAYAVHAGDEAGLRGALALQGDVDAIAATVIEA